MVCLFSHAAFIVPYLWASARELTWAIEIYGLVSRKKFARNLTQLKGKVRVIKEEVVRFGPVNLLISRAIESSMRLYTNLS